MRPMLVESMLGIGITGRQLFGACLRDAKKIQRLQNPSNFQRLLSLPIIEKEVFEFFHSLKKVEIHVWFLAIPKI